jgi:hypothetical protein
LQYDATKARDIAGRDWVARFAGDWTRVFGIDRSWSTVAAVALAGALALLLAYGEVRVLQADGYKALYDGRWIVHHGVPQTNPLSAVAHGARWVDAQWLAEVISYAVWSVGGLALVAIFSAVSIAAGYMIFAALLRHRGLSVGWTVVFTAAALLGLRHWAFVRAQDLALPLFALLLVICLSDSERERPGRRLLLLLPLLVLWANIHGSVLLGTVLAVGYLVWRTVSLSRARATRAARATLALACAAALAPLVTPYGPQVIHYYLQFVGNHAQHVAGAEGRSPAFPGGSFFAVYGGLALVVVVGARALLTRRPAPWLLLGACLLTAIAAAGRLGNLPWHMMVTALLIAELVKHRLPVGAGRTAPLAGATVLAAIIGVAVIGVLAVRRTSSYESDTALHATAAAAAVADTHPHWVILADNLDAAALEWHEPQLAGRIAYDARVELYSESAMMRWAIFQSGRLPGWRATTNGYQLLIGATGFRPGLVARLETLPGGVVIAHDRTGIAVTNTRARTSAAKSP